MMIGVFLDTETNGLNPQVHRILEICYRLIDLENGKNLFSFHAICKQPKQVFQKSSSSSLQVNGFTFEQLENGFEEKEIKKLIISSFEKHHIVRKKAVFICQNPSFDRSFFSTIIDVETQEKMQLPYHWLDLASMYWAISLQQKTIYPWKTGISKDNIATALGIPKEPSPHRAQNGVDHLIQCYHALVGYPSE